MTKSIIFSLSLSIAFLFQSINGQGQNLSIAQIFNDNMVLQQGIHFPVWGTSQADELVTIEFAGETVKINADKDGNWKAIMPVFEVGGPYEMIVSAIDTSVTFNNVMVGEVWLASGQSNMEWRIGSGVTNKQEVIDHVNETDIRFINIPKNLSRKPILKIKETEWQITDTSNVNSCSAVAYYFAREISKNRNVTVGIINSSWGGTHIEPWISAEMIGSHPSFEEKVKECLESSEDWSAMHEENMRIAEKRKQIIETASDGIKLHVQQPKFDDSQWGKIDYPVGVRSIGASGWGFFWLRKTIQIPSSFIGKDLQINLGKISMGDVTYFNGKEIGHGSDQRNERIYTIPSKLVKKGENVIAVRILSLWGGGSLGLKSSNPLIAVKDGKSDLSISLQGEWLYKTDIEPEFPMETERRDYPAAIFNAMINPIIPYGIKGTIWYQGESNADGTNLYNDLLPLMMNDWRIRWKEFYTPFLIVQLANYGNNDIGWPLVREAQLNATKYPNAGMAVTIDIGEPENVHPQNKRDVGKRLYIAARHIAYGEDNVYSGPVYESMEIQEDKAIITFNLFGSKLMSKNGEKLSAFTIAGEDHNFLPAHARIEDNKVIVWSEDVSNPIAVRYGWAGSPECNLYNIEGLPASPFRTDHWELKSK